VKNKRWQVNGKTGRKKRKRIRFKEKKKEKEGRYTILTRI